MWPNPQKTAEANAKLWSSFENVHRATSFNQDEWSKLYIDMNEKIGTEVKNTFEKDFFKLINNAVFGKTIENVKKQRY